MNETNADLIAGMARVNGLAGTKIKVVEECGELIAAVARGKLDNIIEELVDAEIVIRQMLWVLPPGSLSKRDEVMEAKMERIKALIREHEAKNLDDSNKKDWLMREKINAPMMNHEPTELDDVNG